MDTKSDSAIDSSSDPGVSERIRLSERKRPRCSPLKTHAALCCLQQWAANTSLTGLTRKQAASIASYEPHCLSHLFRRKMGKTFLSWRREHRTPRAIAALQEGELPIIGIVKLDEFPVSSSSYTGSALSDRGALSHAVTLSASPRAAAVLKRAAASMISTSSLSHQKITNVSG